MPGLDSLDDYLDADPQDALDARLRRHEARLEAAEILADEIAEGTRAKDWPYRRIH